MRKQKDEPGVRPTLNNVIQMRLPYMSPASPPSVQNVSETGVEKDGE